MTVSLRLSELVAQLGGELLGDGSIEIEQIATLDRARANQISFLNNSKYCSQLAMTQAAAVILGTADENATDLPRIIVKNPDGYRAKVAGLLNPLPTVKSGIHPSAIVGINTQVDITASVAATAVIGDGVTIGAHSVIGAGCYIGDNTHIGRHSRFYPRVVVYHDCIIGDRLTVHAGAVIGSDGFGITMDEGHWLKIPQIGSVVIGDDVEIGANTTIDRGALDDTVIEDDVKLDNQIQIAHNVRIGAHTAIAGCVGIAGSATIGQHCLIGGGAVILGHLTIADHVEVAACSLIRKSIHVSGNYGANLPADNMKNWRKNAVHLRHLDDMAKRIKILEQELKLLKGKS
jgi:UDP-3-O-[3-hydroxymyristoyl] glucosamine N-acyltransferase